MRRGLENVAFFLVMINKSLALGIRLIPLAYEESVYVYRVIPSKAWTLRELLRSWAAKVPALPTDTLRQAAKCDLCRVMRNDGSPGRTRTSHRAVNSRLLYRLSYRGIQGRAVICKQSKCARNTVDRLDRNRNASRGSQCGSIAKAVDCECLSVELSALERGYWEELTLPEEHSLLAQSPKQRRP